MVCPIFDRDDFKSSAFLNPLSNSNCNRAMQYLFFLLFFYTTMKTITSFSSPLLVAAPPFAIAADIARRFLSPIDQARPALHARTTASTLLPLSAVLATSSSPRQSCCEPASRASAACRTRQRQTTETRFAKSNPILPVRPRPARFVSLPEPPAPGAFVQGPT